MTAPVALLTGDDRAAPLRLVRGASRAIPLLAQHAAPVRLESFGRHKSRKIARCWSCGARARRVIVQTRPRIAAYAACQSARCEP